MLLPSVPLFHFKTQVGESVRAFDLQDHGIARLQGEYGAAQSVHRSNWGAVERVDDIAGLQAGVWSNEVAGAAKDDDSGLNA